MFSPESYLKNVLEFAKQVNCKESDMGEGYFEIYINDYSLDPNVEKKLSIGYFELDKYSINIKITELSLKSEEISGLLIGLKDIIQDRVVNIKT